MKIYRLSQSNFLETPETAWEWAKEHVDIQVTEKSLAEDLESGLYEDGSDKHNYDQTLLEDYIEKCSLYSDKYHNVMKQSSITIYRAIRAPSVEDIDFNNIGTHWSFRSEGAGSYGEVQQEWRNHKDIVLTATAQPKDVDWEYCFTSFMYYGEDQWECALDEGSKVNIIEIDGSSFNIQAEVWNIL